jgi:hypothetical protein
MPFQKVRAAPHHAVVQPALPSAATKLATLSVSSESAATVLIRIPTRRIRSTDCACAATGRTNRCHRATDTPWTFGAALELVVVVVVVGISKINRMGM